MSISVKIAGVELRLILLAALLLSLSSPAVYAMVGPEASLSVTRAIRTFYLLTGPVVMTVVLYHCGLVMFLNSKQERNRDAVKSAVKRMLYGAAALMAVGFGFVMTAGVTV